MSKPKAQPTTTAYDFYLTTKAEIRALRANAKNNHGGPDLYEIAADELESAAWKGSELYRWMEGE